ncbi:MAG: Ig-like domain-containing protein [Oscillospiraceae bacterium]
MKRISLLFLATFLLITGCVQVFAAENDTNIIMDVISEPSSENAIVNIVISGNSEPEMIQFCLGYDPDKMECVSASVGSVLSGNTAPTINVENGKIYFVWDSLRPITTEGVLLQLEFKSIDKQADSEIWIDKEKSFIIADESFNNIAQSDKVENAIVFSSENSNSSESETSSSTGNDSSQTQSETNTSGQTSSTNEKVEEGYNNGLTLKDNKLSVEMDSEIKLDVEDANEKLVWSSSNENVAVVDEDGNITAIGPGTATITVTDESGGKEASCVITVTDTLETEAKTEKTNMLVPLMVLICVVVVLFVVIYVKRTKSKSV